MQQPLGVTPAAGIDCDGVIHMADYWRGGKGETCYRSYMLGTIVSSGRDLPVTMYEHLLPEVVGYGVPPGGGLMGAKQLRRSLSGWTHCFVVRLATHPRSCQHDYCIHTLWKHTWVTADLDPFTLPAEPVLVEWLQPLIPFALTTHLGRMYVCTYVVPRIGSCNRSPTFPFTSSFRGTISNPHHFPLVATLFHLNFLPIYGLRLFSYRQLGNKIAETATCIALDPPRICCVSHRTIADDGRDSSSLWT
jgi:hypothetical protein